MCRDQHKELRVSKKSGKHDITKTKQNKTKNKKKKPNKASITNSKK